MRMTVNSNDAIGQNKQDQTYANNDKYCEKRFWNSYWAFQWKQSWNFASVFLKFTTIFP